MKAQQVGVRELRQSLPGRGSALERLISSGRAVPARLDLTELGPPPRRAGTMTLSEALAEQRGEDRLV